MSLLHEYPLLQKQHRPVSYPGAGHLSRSPPLSAKRVPQQPSKQPLMEWHLGLTLSPQKRLTHVDARNVNWSGKVPKHRKGRDIPSRERKQKENQVTLFSSGHNKTETSHRHVSLLPLQSMYNPVIEECIYYRSIYACILKVA